MARLSDRDRFINSLPRDGGFRTNKEVRDDLGLTRDRYWDVRAGLLDEGVIIISRGHGGRVALKAPVDQLRALQTEPLSAQVKEEIAEAKEEIREEVELYEPFANSIKNRAKDEGLEQTVVEIIARQGRRHTGGLWSRPDICQISVQNLPYLGQKVVEVTTFELKAAPCNVDAVYETLSHSRRAHRSYLAIFCPDSGGEVKRQLERIKLECARTGVGLITFSDPGDFETFETLVEPTGNWADLSEVNEFVATQIADRERIRNWL
jgi:hypothetical protein